MRRLTNKSCFSRLRDILRGTGTKDGRCGLGSNLFFGRMDADGLAVVFQKELEAWLILGSLPYKLCQQQTSL